MYTYIYIYICIYVCMYVCTYVCMYIFASTGAYMHVKYLFGCHRNEVESRHTPDQGYSRPIDDHEYTCIPQCVSDVCVCLCVCLCVCACVWVSATELTTMKYVHTTMRL